MSTKKTAAKTTTAAGKSHTKVFTKAPRFTGKDLPLFQGLEVEPVLGKIYCKDNGTGKKELGKANTSSKGNARWKMWLDGTVYERGTLIFLYANGFIPSDYGMTLNHLNGDSLDDRIDNLRSISSRKVCMEDYANVA